MSAVPKAGVGAVLVALALVLSLRGEAARTGTTAGFWFRGDTFQLPADDEARIGGPITPTDLRRIEATARAALSQAFAGTRLDIGDDPHAFWRVEVVQDLAPPEGMWKGPPSGAAQSMLLGPLGGRGSVSFLSIAQYAVRFAPDGAPRADVLDGIGRGIGRAAAHEFAHQIVNGNGHNPDDVASYEYPHADREEQYYGELHWSTMRDALVKRIGAQAR